jgi:multidrug transporter EmrE-like cation transporter
MGQCVLGDAMSESSRPSCSWETQIAASRTNRKTAAWTLLVAPVATTIDDNVYIATTAQQDTCASGLQLQPAISDSVIDLNLHLARESLPLPHPLQVLPVAVIFLTAQFLFTLSLANTSVTSNTILSSSASMWTLLTSALVLRERVTPVKLLSVVAVMAGAPQTCLP